jgi:hypothetical protein
MEDKIVNGSGILDLKMYERGGIHDHSPPASPPPFQSVDMTTAVL